MNAVDFASLLCSRLCHDMLSPVGALNNGVSRDEIKEILLQACIYCGIPAGLDAFKVAADVFKTVDSERSA